MNEFVNSNERRAANIEAWNRVFGKEMKYTSGCEGSLGESLVIYIEKCRERNFSVNLEGLQSLTWHTGDSKVPSSIRKRYISKDQAKKAYDIIELIGISPPVFATMSLEESNELFYNSNLDIQICNIAEALLEGDDVFFSEEEISEILKRIKFVREIFHSNSNLIMRASIKHRQMLDSKKVDS